MSRKRQRDHSPLLDDDNNTTLKQNEWDIVHHWYQKNGKDFMKDLLPTSQRKEFATRFGMTAAQLSRCLSDKRGNMARGRTHEPGYEPASKKNASRLPREIDEKVLEFLDSNPNPTKKEIEELAAELNADSLLVSNRIKNRKGNQNRALKNKRVFGAEPRSSTRTSLCRKRSREEEELQVSDQESNQSRRNKTDVMDDGGAKSGSTSPVEKEPQAPDQKLGRQNVSIDDQSNRHDEDRQAANTNENVQEVKVSDCDIDLVIGSMKHRCSLLKKDVFPKDRNYLNKVEKLHKLTECDKGTVSFIIKINELATEDELEGNDDSERGRIKSRVLEMNQLWKSYEDYSFERLPVVYEKYFEVGMEYIREYLKITEEKMKQATKIEDFTEIEVELDRCQIDFDDTTSILRKLRIRSNVKFAELHNSRKKLQNIFSSRRYELWKKMRAVNLQHILPNEDIVESGLIASEGVRKMEVNDRNSNSPSSSEETHEINRFLKNCNTVSDWIEKNSTFAHELNDYDIFNINAKVAELEIVALECEEQVKFLEAILKSANEIQERFPSCQESVKNRSIELEALWKKQKDAIEKKRPKILEIEFFCEDEKLNDWMSLQDDKINRVTIYEETVEMSRTFDNWKHEVDNIAIILHKMRKFNVDVLEAVNIYQVRRKEFNYLQYQLFEKLKKGQTPFHPQDASFILEYCLAEANDTIEKIAELDHELKAYEFEKNFESIPFFTSYKEAISQLEPLEKIVVTIGEQMEEYITLMRGKDGSGSICALATVDYYQGDFTMKKGDVLDLIEIDDKKCSVRNHGFEQYLSRSYFILSVDRKCDITLKRCELVHKWMKLKLFANIKSYEYQQRMGKEVFLQGADMFGDWMNEEKARFAKMKTEQNTPTGEELQTVLNTFQENCYNKINHMDLRLKVSTARYRQFVNNTFDNVAKFITETMPCVRTLGAVQFFTFDVKDINERINKADCEVQKGASIVQKMLKDEQKNIEQLLAAIGDSSSVDDGLFDIQRSSNFKRRLLRSCNYVASLCDARENTIFLVLFSLIVLFNIGQVVYMNRAKIFRLLRRGADQIPDDEDPILNIRD